MSDNVIAEELIEMVTPYVQDHTRASELSIERKVLTTLNFFATGSYQTSVGKNMMIGMSQASVSRNVKEITEVLNRPEIFQQWVHFPTNIEDVNKLRQKFYNKFKMPGVIGCIDCTQVAIFPPPINHPDCPEHIFINRKNYHSINVQLALSGFLMMMTQNGKLLYISDNAAEYLGHSMVSVLQEDLLIHGDSVYDIIDKQDHQAIQCELGRPVNTGSNSNPSDEVRLFLCRMNVSRNARRQMRFGDQKVVLVQGRYLSFLPLCSRNEPVFLATCTPVAMPETRECVVQGATNVFTSIHSMDMRFIHIDNNGEFYLGFPRSDLQGVSWYRLLHWECTREAQSKHRLITQSEQERSCILLAQFQRRSGEWIWMHCVLQVKETSESNQQPVIVCTNQVLSEAEAAVMKTNSWLYHYYSVQNKLQYGLTYDVGPSSRLLYYPEHTQTPEFAASHDTSGYAHLAAMPTTLQPHLTHHAPATHAHHNQHHHHHRRADSEPVDYSYSKRKPKELHNLELDVADHDAPDVEGGSSGLLVISHLSSERPRTLLKVDPSELMDQWNPSPPWSDTLQKVPDLCHQELSPYIGSTPPTPTATPSTQTSAFSFDWMPEQYVPSMAAVASAEDVERQIYWPSEHRLFPLQPPPKRNHPPTGRSESADRDTP